MENFSRATRGGVGVVFGLGLALLAAVAGWTSGNLYDGRFAAGGCGAACSSSAEASDAQPTQTTTRAVLGASNPQPTPTEPADLPFVSGESIAVIDTCGALLFGRDEHEQFRPASLTKLMTAAVAIDQADVDDMYVSKVDAAALYDATGSTVMGLRIGQELSLLDLLYGLLLPSGNDAAITIAEGVAGSEAKFVEMMNEKAESLALNDSHFTNPHGLDSDGLYSSAYDMALLSRYVMQNPTLREIVSSVSWQPRWDGEMVWNGNRLIGEYEGADGVKIGYTEESKQTMVASAERDGRRIIASVMRSEDRYSDASRLLDWAFEQPSSCP
jgi:serine-type D-Ala-D-Ala carboxypeptidase (penicillin-binding protein 5/6)